MLRDLIPSTIQRVTALETGNDNATVWIRQEDDTVTTQTIPFQPFMLTTQALLFHGFPAIASVEELEGDAPFRYLINFPTADAFEQAKKFLKTTASITTGSPNSPVRAINDLTQQALIRNQIRLFAGMRFDEVRRLQLDIETLCSPGYDFPNAERENDTIVLIALRDSTGWEEVISAQHMEEKAMLERMISLIQERDPDIIEGHNLFRFDLPYLETRAKRYKLKLLLGRDGSVIKRRTSRFSAAERTVNYTRYDIYGRHIADTYHLALFYDAVKRDLDGYSLKTIAKHFKVASPDRVYVDASDMNRIWLETPEKAAVYCLDDVRETDAISRILSPATFYQTQLIPLSYQNCIVRGNATRIDSMFTAEYIRAKRSMPYGERARMFSGALTKAFADGVFRDVTHCDVRSLYPSIILSQKWTPCRDTLGIFPKLLEKLRQFRLTAKDAMRQADTEERKNYYSSLQATFKILINSFYGYLGFEQGFLNDFNMADRVTTEGRRILTSMLDFLQRHDANVIEMDTDGIYFQPGSIDAATLERTIPSILPDGIEVEFDETYNAMFSYKSKNYALLKQNGELTISGAALKSRGLEPFQRKYMHRIILAILHEDAAAAATLNEEYTDALKNHKLPFTELAKSETLSDSPESYKRKMNEASFRRSAAYELALQSGKDYRQGDQISFYITGTKRKVSVVENAKLLSDAVESVRDENVEYYLDKLNELQKKFAPYLPAAKEDSLQMELDLFG